MTTRLTLEYVLEGKQPGYTLRGVDGLLSEAQTRAVWRQAMPRGHGWAAPNLRNARAIKVFPIDAHTTAVSEITVTDQQDEQGRRGIRHAEIELFPSAEVPALLKRRLASYPEALQREASRHLTLELWKNLLNSGLPKARRSPPQIILAHPYDGPQAWLPVEALGLQIASWWALHAIPGWGRFHSLTTLALTPLDESRIVALPLEKATSLTTGLPVIVIP